ncbi:MAG: HAMP domain-containing sensor histidine kinase [Lachnospiraceae bacterium]
MDTKWKNIEKVAQWVQKKEVKGIIGIVAGAVGMWILVYCTQDVQRLSTQETWLIGFIANLCLAMALLIGIHYFINRNYKNHMLGQENFYVEWKHQWKQQQKKVALFGAMGMLVSIIIFYYIMYVWYAYNYSVGYLMIVTVLNQLIVAEISFNTFMFQIMSQYLETQETVNQMNIEKAVRSEKMKVDLISNVSHDLKTPLTSMVGYIELMKKEELTPILEDYVEVLSSKAQKLKTMIESLFDLAKTSSGNVQLNLEAMELNRLIEQVQADMEDKITKSDAELVVELTLKDTAFVADSGYMYRICQNLMENALKYSAAHTRIFLKTEVVIREGKLQVQLEITNTADYRMNFTKEQIVERFARGDEARSTDGNGLGLAIVSTYTSALGGWFDVNIDCDQFKAIVEFPK